jgi:hypothetical protein
MNVVSVRAHEMNDVHFNFSLLFRLGIGERSWQMMMVGFHQFYRTKLLDEVEGYVWGMLHVISSIGIDSTCIKP